MKTRTAKMSDSSFPDDKEVESLLAGFNPEPSSAFYSRSQKAPWKRKSTLFPDKCKIISVPLRPLLLGATIFLIIFASMAISFIPSIRGIARQIFYSFVSSSSTQIVVRVTPSDSSDLFHYSDASNFPLTISDAQKQAGFDIMQLTTMPKDLELIGVRYDPGYNAAIILYQGNNFSLFLSQRPTGSGADVFSIGPNTPVKVVRIGEELGEFVAGGWKAISTQTIKNNDITPQSMISAVWDDDLPQSTLRWKSQDIVYEIRTIGGGSPSQSDLIAMAHGLK